VECGGVVQAAKHRIGYIRAGDTGKAVDGEVLTHPAPRVDVMGEGHRLHRPLEGAPRRGVGLGHPARRFPPIDRGSHIRRVQCQGVLRALHHDRAVRQGESEGELRPAAQAFLTGPVTRREGSAPVRHTGMGGLVHDGGGNFGKRNLRIHREGELHQTLPGHREESPSAGETLHHEPGEVGAEAPVTPGRIGGDQIERRRQTPGDLLRLNVGTGVDDTYG